MQLTRICEKCQELLKCTWVPTPGRIGRGGPNQFRAHVSLQRDGPGSSNSNGDVVSLVPYEHYSSNGLRRSAQARCQLCRLFDGDLEQWLGQSTGGPAGNQPAAEVILSKEEHGGILSLCYPHGRAAVFFFPSLLVLPVELRPHAYVVFLPSPPDRIRKYTLNTTTAIKDWLQKCHTSHNACRRWTAAGADGPDSGSGPSRLLDIEVRSEADVRLVDTASLPKPVSYATLSHCWGSKGLTQKLTTHNMQQFKDSLPISELPTTFQDAVTAARLLELKFLWIDALCIIQDSKEDWSYEAPRMASVYSQAHVNLAATASSDSSGGLFCQQPRFSNDVHQVRVGWPGYPAHMNVARQSWTICIEGAPLNRRGWVLQERLIAPRTVHFASNQIWWECRELCTSEHQPPVTNNEPGRDLHKVLQGGNFSHLAARYLTNHLTHASDRLVALSGLAQFFARLHGHKDEGYLAGLWRSELPGNLLWYVGRRFPAPEPYEAPSWSWASVYRGVMGRVWNQEGENAIAEVVEAQVTRQSQNPFGDVQGGQLRCVGILHPIRVITKATKPDTDDDYVPDSLSLSDGPEMLFGGEIAGPEANPRRRVEIVFVSFDRLAIIAGGVASALRASWLFPIMWHDEVTSPIASQMSSDEENSDSSFLPRRTRALLLQPIEDRNGFFKRVGLAVADQRPDRWREKHWISCKLDEGMYTKDVGNGRYEFVIE